MCFASRSKNSFNFGIEKVYIIIGYIDFQFCVVDLVTEHRADFTSEHFYSGHEKRSMR